MLYCLNIYNYKMIAIPNGINYHVKTSYDSAINLFVKYEEENGFVT